MINCFGILRPRKKMAENYPTLLETKVSIAPEMEMDRVEYTLRKRLPHKLPRRKNDIYVNMKTDFKAQLTRCQKLLDSGNFSDVCIHGLGLAINRAINIALQLEANSFGALQLAASTSTVELVDDLEPEADEGEPMARTRNNSAIHIKVFRSLPKTKCMQDM